MWILVGIVAIWLIMRFPSWRLGFGRGGGALKILGTLAGIVLIIAIMLWSQYGLDYSATALTPPSDIMPFLNKNFAWLGWLAGHPGALAWVGVTVVATFLAFGCFPGGTAAVTILGFCLVLGYLMFLQPAYQQTATNVAPQVTAPMTTTEPPAAPQPKQAAPAGKFDGTYCGGGDIVKGIRQYCFQIKGNVGIAIESNATTALVNRCYGSTKSGQTASAEGSTTAVEMYSRSVGAIPMDTGLHFETKDRMVSGSGSWEGLSNSPTSIFHCSTALLLCMRVPTRE